MTATDKQSRAALLPLVKWLVTAVLFVALSLAQNVRVPGLEERPADESFSGTLVLQKKDSDEADNPFDLDPSIEVLLAHTTVVSAALVSAFSTTRHITAACLAAFISPPTRAPPLRH